ncbi:MAG: hypothetical protein A3F94_03030 [Candidatus Spechtbacteria bacterium RIFCSPLOWO2_12_FULL_38_22]|uniref:tRNA pseudouridine(55) synthase n=1 Tax=Candidatus Spechtbacteria bacterium RIFCSPLOWO2_12_FULL_38_22 TaxID=1802165 RepID=A0A1G2HHI4_9BACT|nr:MAG: hypothetical protein A2728_01660 [Candidatus Spechtbacteria bacterium RIFCSPHIGHO2_01_FULL_38_11]OGZ59164.1 MAG: hypothetical protein A3E58_01460 [Candidatus Spechtbacteria bacterium RIFCSPHIGHO2_12_FULL_38_30]OGZ61111.1 MAG: hypothetical protein A3A00_01730 [Candidatus Spechtbacteria bacterium RIFCSPLOWO2_01_FULL_38_20]OGZ61955.1 MAG: hypothetical protein A3F94_03030 [Candidatus Spechtbacteria bacterium RIFCSPLOWO2_12_FULL_38_22]
MKVLNIYKPLGKSPLEAIELFRKQNPKYKDIKLGYAGRLDPMAEGVLLVLVGEELKNQKKYWTLNKKYEAEILLGFGTDAYDILGIPKMSQLSIINYPLSSGKNVEQKKIKKVLKNFEGKLTFGYPPYSSRTVNGKPLFWWARQDRLSEIEIPKKTICIKKMKLLKITEIKKEELKNLIIHRINLVKGDFRQELIKTAWEKTLQETTQEKFMIIKIKTRVSSGTYIRTIADELGKKLNTRALLLHLKRTQVGNYTIKKSQQLE